MTKKLIPGLILISLVCGFCAVVGGILVWPRIRPQPAERNEQIFQGINYIRDIRQSPRPIILHSITINLRHPGIRFLVTPGDPNAELPLKGRTTSHFLDEFDLQLAVNGDGFEPWHSNGIFDTYPRSGDPVKPIGFAASEGVVYSQVTDNEPILYISRTNRARFNSAPGNIFNAISGNTMLVEKGEIVIDDDQTPQPRTAIGVDKNERNMIIVVVDGRLPGYSEGATLQELAQIMIEFGTFFAMNLDGGGSSTLVKEARLGQTGLLNTPIQNQIPNRQRVVGNHLGIYAKPLE